MKTRFRLGRAVPGLILIVLGLWFLLSELGVEWLNADQGWPIFVALVGVLFWLGFIFDARHDPGHAFLGTGAVLTGLYLLLFTTGVYQWSDMDKMWPGFALIGGIAFLVLWLANRLRDPGTLVPAVGGILAGLVGFSYTLGGLSEDRFQTIMNLWPVLLILLGVILLLRVLFGRR